MAQRDQQPSPTPYEAIVKGKDMPAYSLPESFKALVREMQGLGLDVKLILEREGEVTLKESKEDIRHKADELDLIFQVHPEEVSETIEVHHRWIEAQTVEEDEARQAARLFIACEGIVSAPESAHAIASAIREVKQA